MAAWSKKSTQGSLLVLISVCYWQCLIPEPQERIGFTSTKPAVWENKQKINPLLSWSINSVRIYIGLYISNCDRSLDRKRRPSVIGLMWRKKKNAWLNACLGLYWILIKMLQQITAQAMYNSCGYKTGSNTGHVKTVKRPDDVFKMPSFGTHCSFRLLILAERSGTRCSRLLF